MDIQSQVRTFFLNRTWKKMRLGVLATQQALRIRGAKLQLRSLKSEQREVGAMMNKFHKAQDEAKEMRRRFTEVENKRIKAISEKSALEDKHGNQQQQMVELQAQLSQMKEDHAKAIEALRETQAEQIEALEELEALESRDRE